MNTKIQIQKYKYKNTNTKIQIRKYKNKNTNTKIRIRIYKYKNKRLGHGAPQLQLHTMTWQIYMN